MTKKIRKNNQLQTTSETQEQKNVETSYQPRTIHNPGVRFLWNIVKTVYKIISCPFNILMKLLILPVKITKDFHNMLIEDPKTRHLQEFLVWMGVTIGTYSIITFLNLIVSMFTYENLTKAHSAQTQVDAAYYVHQANLITNASSFIFAVIIIASFVYIKNRYKKFHAKTLELKQKP